MSIPLVASPPENWTRVQSQDDSTKPRLFQPTHARFKHSLVNGDDETRIKQAPHVMWEWNSRNHRKGIFPYVVDKSNVNIKRPPFTSYRWLGLDIGNISWWIAVLFLVGSIAWCLNGVSSFCFFNDDGQQAQDFEAWTAFAGGTLFWIGAILSYIESINPHPDITFGHEVTSELGHVIQPLIGRRGRRRHFGKFVAAPGNPKADSDQTDTPTTNSDADPKRSWSWIIPHDSVLHPPAVGFVANVIQLYGATVFQASVIMGLSGVLPPESTDSRPASGVLPYNTKIDWMAGYWGCQIYASPGFIISGIMFMLETQKKWYKPVLWGKGSLGWHLGFWNALGGVGFLLCGIFGVWRETASPNQSVQKWGTAFSTFWGSWAFLIGSYIQYFEALNPHAYT